ncbi:DUF4253 domain-containing protein [Streptomyces sp. NPDC059656]|uniref:DUF4253 domain-containing protein n=1 Tax=Streptomyces sp. NPDC059656 TaxID=3346898 RepID=UPI0036CBF430
MAAFRRISARCCLPTGSPELREEAAWVPATVEGGAVEVSGPRNHDNDTAKISAVLHDWEHRLGTRVVAVGFDTLHLGVAAPPVSEPDALLVSAERFAFCPDNVRQGRRPYTLTAYADRITGAHRWDFWWD